MSFHWIFRPENSSLVGGASFVLTSVGILLTLIGVYATYRQASRARSAAEAADNAVRDFRFRAASYDGYRDVSEAAYALEVTRRHLNNDAWSDASDSYEDARRALVRIRNNLPSLDDEGSSMVDLMTDQMANFCKAVDRALSGKRSFPDKAKCLEAIRINYDRIVIIRHSISERM